MSTKTKFEIEIPIKSSPKFLFQYLATPDGLGEWFADNVNSRGELFTFMWDDSEEQAKRVSQKINERIRFKWLEEEDEKAFFEFKIQVDDLTSDVSLIITDFSDDDDVDESKMFWENKISELKRIIGA